MKTLFEHGIVITENPQDEVYAKGWVLVEDDKIFGVGEGEYEGDAAVDCRINASGKCVLPGLVNVHTHVCGSLFKAMTEDVPGAFYGLALPMERLLTPEYTYQLSLLGTLECLKGGVTCINDIYHYMANTADAVRDLKIRGVLAHKILERDLAKICEGDYTLLPEMGQKRLQDNIDLIEKYHGNDKIICKFGPHATDTISMNLARQIHDLGEKYGVGYHIHVAQKTEEINFLQREYGCTPVEYLKETGLLCEKTTAAHCVYVSDSDMDLLAQGGLTVAHCGEMTGKRGQFPPMKAFVDKGIKFCIGTDWVTMDPWTAMRMSIIGDRMMGCGLADANAHTALRKMTIEPAVHLGLGDQIGSLEAGKQADIIMIDYRKSSMIPMGDDPIATLVYNANRNDVCYVMCGGDVLVQDYELKAADENAILEDGQKVSEEIYEKYRQGR